MRKIIRIILIFIAIFILISEPIDKITLKFIIGKVVSFSYLYFLVKNYLWR